MPLQRVGPFFLPSSLLRKDWLISRLTAKLFFVSALLVMALTAAFAWPIDTGKMSIWYRIPDALLGVLGPLGLFFLWFGMWRYWVIVDNSRRWVKRLWFLVLLFGFWWASVLYYFAVYLPQVLSRTESEA
jgi:hypothetical protein